MKKSMVLVIDDSLTVRAIIEQILSKDQALEVVASAGDVVAARQLIRLHRPALITLDLAMPGIDGLTFLDELAVEPHAPVLVVSSLTRHDTDVAADAIARGAAACFDKARLLSHAHEFKDILKKLLTAGPPKAAAKRGAVLSSDASRSSATTS